MPERSVCVEFGEGSRKYGCLGHDSACDFWEPLNKCPVHYNGRCKHRLEDGLASCLNKEANAACEVIL